MTMESRVIHNRRKKQGRSAKQEAHKISIHPKLWAWAKQRAEEEGYHGGVSGYLGGLILFDRSLGRKHWLTVEILNNPEQFDKVLKEIEEHNPMGGAGTWIEHRIKELADKKRATPHL